MNTTYLPILHSPVGVPNEFILREWANYNKALDANQLPKSVRGLNRMLIQGVKPVAGPIPVHHNTQVDSALKHVIFRDDVDPELGISITDISVFTRPTTHSLDHWGGWFDAATADAVIRRFANTPRPQRAVIGPWNHGAGQQVGAEKNPFPLFAQMKESLRLFDDPPATRELHYFTLFKNQWKTTLEWPPEGMTSTRLYFQSQNMLATNCPESELADRFKVDFSASTGLNNRWQTELDQRHVEYTAQKGPAGLRQRSP